MRLGVTPAFLSLGALLLVAAVSYRILQGGAFEWGSPLGDIKLGENTGPVQTETIQLELGQKPDVVQIRPDKNLAVWKSACPPKTKPISGVCFLKEGNATLQSTAAYKSDWYCIWSGTVAQAVAQAFCIPQQN
jgi:hypothetical protein